MKRKPTNTMSEDDGENDQEKKIIPQDQNDNEAEDHSEVKAFQKRTPNYQCQYCDRMYTTAYNRLRHVSAKHMDEYESIARKKQRRIQGEKSLSLTPRLNAKASSEEMFHIHSNDSSHSFMTPRLNIPSAPPLYSIHHDVGSFDNVYPTLNTQSRIYPSTLLPGLPPISQGQTQHSHGQLPLLQRRAFQSPQLHQLPQFHQLPQIHQLPQLPQLQQLHATHQQHQQIHHQQLPLPTLLSNRPPFARYTIPNPTSLSINWTNHSSFPTCNEITQYSSTTFYHPPVVPLIGSYNVYDNSPISNINHRQVSSASAKLAHSTQHPHVPPTFYDRMSSRISPYFPQNPN